MQAKNAERVSVILIRAETCHGAMPGVEEVARTCNKSEESVWWANGISRTAFTAQFLANMEMLNAPTHQNAPVAPYPPSQWTTVCLLVENRRGSVGSASRLASGRCRSTPGAVTRCAIPVRRLYSTVSA